MSQPTYAVVGDIKGDFTKMITTASCPKLGNEVSATRVTIQKHLDDPRDAKLLRRQ